MNAPTAIATYIFGFLIAVLIGLVIRRMLRGWQNRAARQEDLIGVLPRPPEPLGPAVIAPISGLYVGSTLGSDWLERVNVGDLGYRSRATLTRYPEGILLERSGVGPIWIPSDAIITVHTGHALAGKVIPDRGNEQDPRGLLVIRWRLPSGTEIDTGFRGDDRRDHERWTTGAAA